MTHEPVPRTDAATPAPTWQERMEAVRTVPEILAMCRDFLESLTPEEVMSLPEACRPPSELDAEALAAYALELARCEREQGPGASPVLASLAGVFAHAAAHLARVMAPPRRVLKDPLL